MANQTINIDILIEKAQASQSLTDFRGNLKELNKALSQATDPKDVERLQKAIAATTKASEDFRDKLQTIKLDTFEQGAKIGQLVAGGFAAATSAAALFGAESENVEKALLRVQAAIGLLQGLQSLKELPRVFKDLRIAINLTNVSLTTTNALLAALGIPLLIAAIAVLIANFDKVKQFFDDTFPAISNFFETLIPRLVAVGRTIVDFLRGNFDVAANFEKNLTNIVKEEEEERLKIRLAARKEFEDAEAKFDKQRRDTEVNNIRLLGRERLLEANRRRASQLEISRITLNNLQLELAALKRLKAPREEQLRLEEQIVAERNKLLGLIKDDAIEKRDKEIEDSSKLLIKLIKSQSQDLEKITKDAQDKVQAIIKQSNSELGDIEVEKNQRVRDANLQAKRDIAAANKSFEQIEEERIQKLLDIDEDYNQQIVNSNLKTQLALKDVYKTNSKEIETELLNIIRSNLPVYKESIENLKKIKDSLIVDGISILNDKQLEEEKERINDLIKEYEKLISNPQKFLEENRDDFIDSITEVYNEILTLQSKQAEFSINKEKEVTKKQKEELEKRKALIIEYLAVANQIFGDIGQIFNNNLEIQLNELTRSLEKRTQEIQSFYDDQLNRQNLTERKRVSLEKERDKQLAKIEDERRRREKELNDRRAASDLAVALANVSFQVAQQILTNGLAFAPLYIAAGAVASAAAISRFKAETSRQFKDGGLLKGPLHSQGGIQGTGAFSNVEVEGNEYIVNRRATANFLPLLESINANGSNGMNSDFMGELRNIRNELSMIRENPFKAYVIESELTSVQNRVQQLERKVKIS